MNVPRKMCFTFAGTVCLFHMLFMTVYPFRALLLEKKSPADMLGLCCYEFNELVPFEACLLKTKGPAGMVGPFLFKLNSGVASNNALRKGSGREVK